MYYEIRLERNGNDIKVNYFWKYRTLGSVVQSCPSDAQSNAVLDAQKELLLKLGKNKLVTEIKIE